MDFRDKRRIRTVLDELRVTQGGPVASPPQNVRKWPSVAIWAQAVLFQASTRGYSGIGCFRSAESTLVAMDGLRPLGDTAPPATADCSIATMLTGDWSPPQWPRRMPPDVRDGLLQRWKAPLLPTLPSDFNVVCCGSGKLCKQQGCIGYHSDFEKRCGTWSSRGSCSIIGSDCGLHIDAKDICEMLTVELPNNIDVFSVISRLQAESKHMRARYIRLVVFGYQVVRWQALKQILELLHLVHEIGLPDKSFSHALLLSLANIVAEIPEAAPRLQYVIFEDGRREQLWTLPVPPTRS